MVFPKIIRYVIYAATLSCLYISPAFSGLVDFTNGLLNYEAKRFGSAAIGHMQVMQVTVRQMKAAVGPNFTANLLKSKDIQLETPSLRKTNDFYNQIPYFSD